MPILSKNIGAPTTIPNVQQVRKIGSVALVVDASGLYSVVISYTDYKVDGSGEPVGGSIIATKTLIDSDLNASAKTQIDSIFTRALNAL